MKNERRSCGTNKKGRTHRKPFYSFISRQSSTGAAPPGGHEPRGGTFIAEFTGVHQRQTRGRGKDARAIDDMLGSMMQMSGVKYTRSGSTRVDLAA